jgi:hypothetical protein
VVGQHQQVAHQVEFVLCGCGRVEPSPTSGPACTGRVRWEFDAIAPLAVPSAVALGTPLSQLFAGLVAARTTAIDLAGRNPIRTAHGLMLALRAALEEARAATHLDRYPQLLRSCAQSEHQHLPRVAATSPSSELDNHRPPSEPDRETPPHAPARTRSCVRFPILAPPSAGPPSPAGRQRRRSSLRPQP